MRLLFAFVALFAALILSGCSASRHEPNEKYYLVAANIKVPYWQKAGDGIVRAAQQLGVQGEMVGPDSHDAQAEAQQLRDVIAKNPAGILVSAADANVLQAPIDEAIAKGIPVITIDADSPRSKRIVFVGTN